MRSIWIWVPLAFKIAAFIDIIFSPTKDVEIESTNNGYLVSMIYFDSVLLEKFLNARFVFNAQQDTRIAPGYFQPSNFVENAFLEKKPLYMRSISHWPIFSFLKKFQNFFLKKNRILVLKLKLLFYPHSASNLLLFHNFQKVIVFSKKPFFHTFWKKPCFHSHSTAKLLNFVLKNFQYHAIGK